MVEPELSAMPDSTETLRVMCPNLTCRKILAVPSGARGKTVRCRGCATNIRIPAAIEPAAAPKPTEGNGKPGKAVA
jgi:LSD1 subclass zinc finger protein